MGFFAAVFGKLFNDGTELELRGGLNFKNFHFTRYNRDGKPAGWTLQPTIVTDDGPATAWTRYNRTDIQTTEGDFTLGGGGTVRVAHRDIGSTREMRFVIVFGTAPAKGTGSLLFPIAETDGDVEIDLDQFLDFDGEVGSPGFGTISKSTAQLTAPAIEHEDDLQRLKISTQAAIATQFGGDPVAGDMWLIQFAVPVQLPEE